MNWKAVGLPTLAVVVLAGVACDDDPTRTVPEFALEACPAGALNVNAPITLSFTQPVLPSSVQGGNIVVTNVASGTEVPGSVTLNETGDRTQITFVPSDPLPFQTELRIRVQNLLTAEGNFPLGVTVCEVTTQLPPITELFWEPIPTATGNELVGVSLYAPDQGYVASVGGPIFERREGDFFVALHSPHWSASLDVSAVSADHFFSSQIDIRSNAFLVVEAEESGALSRTILSTNLAVQRVVFDEIATSGDIFGVLGGGTAVFATFFKWNPASETFTTQNFSNTGNVFDIDFRTGLAQGAAVSAGVVLPTITTFGQAFVTSDSGRTWSMIPGSTVDLATLFYHGVSRRDNGEVFAAGGNGTLHRFVPSGGTYTRQTITVDASLTSIEPSNPFALAWNDIQFAPNDDSIGWIVGQQLLGVEGGVPRFRGLIYVTRDGGATWTRQGVREAEELGASFPALNRIDALSSSDVWIVGQGGIVLTYVPQP